MPRGRDQDHIPIQVPLSHRAGPSLDEQLVEMNVPPTPVPLDVQPPPQLIPFVYQPIPRPSRSRSTSPPEAIMLPPGHDATGGQSGQPGVPAQGPVYVPIPPRISSAN
ncbi:hypothetical protein OG21DRAFT_902726 [Imleria badia]|nr:hypothetical protein OG21DRAFT_902726 [Imleria badia]